MGAEESFEVSTVVDGSTQQEPYSNVAILPDGSMLLSDKSKHCIWKFTEGKKKTTAARPFSCFVVSHNLRPLSIVRIYTAGRHSLSYLKSVQITRISHSLSLPHLPFSATHDADLTSILCPYQEKGVQLSVRLPFLSACFVAGEVTLYAGMPGSLGNADGKGTQARFCHPTMLDTDEEGNAYVVDNGTAVRRITPSGQ